MRSNALRANRERERERGSASVGREAWNDWIRRRGGGEALSHFTLQEGFKNEAPFDSYCRSLVFLPGSELNLKYTINRETINNRVPPSCRLICR